MHEYRSSTRNLWSRVAARRAEGRNRREIERYLAESSPAARRELEVILSRDHATSDF